MLWSKTYYTTIGQYPTLYDYLAITQEDLIRWEYHLDNPNTSVKPNIFRSTLIPPLVYCGEMSHHMRDSVETYVRLSHLSYHQYRSVCYTTNMTRPYICQSRQPSDHQTVDTKGPSVCRDHESPVRHTTMTTCPSVCQAYTTPVRHTVMMTSLSVHQSYSTSDHHTDLTTSPSVCQSSQSSVRCTVELTRPSVCQRQYTSVCHTINTTSPSICQMQDLSVCYPTRDARHAVCLSSITSVLPSANPTVKIDRIPSTTPGAEPPRDARDSGSARSHSMHLETSSSDRP